MTQEAAKKERVAKVIEVLNKARSMELYAVHQYMNQHYNLDDLDYGEFASKIKLIAIDEMRHAEQFAERIKELGGEPNSELSSKITKGQKVMDVFPFNVKVEDDTIETYNKLLEICRTNGDSVSARLFERILDEEHAIRKMNNERYRQVLVDLELKDLDPKVLAREMNVTVENLYNIRHRAVKQLIAVIREEEHYV